MNWNNLKTTLREWLFPTATAVEEMMKEIRSTSNELKKEMQLDNQIVYYYCAKQGRQWRNGLVGVCLSYRNPNGEIFIRSYTEIIEHIRVVICIHTGFHEEKMVIVSLTELKSL